MKELARYFIEAGAGGVRTYIQSGNVVFRTPNVEPALIHERVEQALERRLGQAIPIVLRGEKALRAVASANPFLEEGVDSKVLHVAFLDRRPGAAAVRALDPERSPPDRFIVHDSEIFLCCPDGLARSKLTNAYFDSTLGTTSTLRNWRAVQKLIELCEDGSRSQRS